MSPRQLASLVAAGRIGFGAVLLAQPERLVVPWIGREGAHAGPRVLGRALGARDLVLGAGAISAADDALAAWLIAALAADATDLLATFAAGRGAAAARAGARRRRRVRGRSRWARPPSAGLLGAAAHGVAGLRPPDVAAAGLAGPQQPLAELLLELGRGVELARPAPAPRACRRPNSRRNSSVVRYSTAPNSERPLSSISPRSSSVAAADSALTPRIRAISGRETGCR